MPKLVLKKETLVQLQSGHGLDHVQGGGASRTVPYYCFAETARCSVMCPPPSQACVPPTTACDPFSQLCTAV